MIKDHSIFPLVIISLILITSSLDDVVILLRENKCYYYINTNEIPGELSCENLISSHVKITRYLHM